MNAKSLLFTCLAGATCSVALDGSPAVSPVAVSRPPSSESSPQLLASGFQGLAGSTVGPDGAIYATEPATGSILRVNPRTGSTTTFASGLPPSVIGLGGVMDVAFIRRRAYALVTLVGPDVGGSSVVGLYRVDGPNQFTVVADIGAYSIQNPPKTAFDVPSGLQYAMEVHHDGFLVTDGHHNRVLQVALNGRISEVIGFDNIVPTGLAIAGPVVLIGAGGTHSASTGGRTHRRLSAAIPPRNRDRVGRAAAGRCGDRAHSHAVRSVAGRVPGRQPPAAPALPDTGALVKVNHDRTFTVVTSGLNQPTSLEFIGDTAYVVSLAGEIWKIGNVH